MLFTTHKPKAMENMTRIQDMKPFSKLSRSLRDDPATIKRVANGSNKTGNVRTGRLVGPPTNGNVIEYHSSPANVHDTTAWAET